MVVNKEVLNEVKGGGHGALLATLGAIGVFLAGLVDGIIRPLRCN